MVYIFLIITQLYNNVATILMYALLCCIYAALFGTAVYFFPRLLSLLQPSLGLHRGLATRLLICNILCLFLFAAHTFEYAQIVVAPPRAVYWWWKYGMCRFLTIALAFFYHRLTFVSPNSLVGILELMPAVVFLIMMHPSANKADRTMHDSENSGQRSGGIRRVASSMRRVDSVSSAQGVSSGRRPQQETTPLLKGPPGYGTAEATA